MDSVKVRLRLSNQYWRLIIILIFGLTLIAWLLNTPPGLLGKADAVGYAVCHRIDIRSFHLGDRQLPLCARCSGMYLGAMLALTYQWITRPKRAGIPSWKIILPTVILVFAFTIDGINSLLSLFPTAPILYQPQNYLRLMTGTGMGVALSILLYPAFNSSVWNDSIPEPALSNLRSFVFLIAMALTLDALVFLNNPIILYPLAWISGGGVLVLLTMVYMMVLLMLFRAERRYVRFGQLIYALMGGLTIALIQIGILDVLRFFFTGTWDGFHL
jgi:uncharacterized membrane protein